MLKFLKKKLITYFLIKNSFNLSFKNKRIFKLNHSNNRSSIIRKNLSNDEVRDLMLDKSIMKVENIEDPNYVVNL